MPANMPVKRFTSFGPVDGITIGLKKPDYHPEIITVIKANPHPRFGKDPNIIDAYGHTEYPKEVNGKIVKNKEEEQSLLKKEN